MRKLKVLQLGRFDNSQFPGGLQVYVQSLMDSTATEVETHNFVASTTKKSWHRKEGDNEVHASASYGLIAAVPISPALVFNVFKAWRKTRFDLVHLHFPDPLGMLIVSLLPKRVPIVVTWHSDVIRQKYALFAYLPILARFLKRVDAVIVATPKHIESCQQLRLYPYPERINVIPFGVDLKRLMLHATSAGKLDELRERHRNETILFALGRHVYYKGYKYLITAMASVENACLLLGGSGPLTAELQMQVVSANLQDKIKFCGHLSAEELAIHLHGCDVFMFPSIETSEAYGFAQIEAMLCGKPVICCELNNGVNYINQAGVTGLSVPPKDVGALSKAIQLLVDQPEHRKTLGINARSRALSEFTLDAMGTRVVKLYRDLIKTSNPFIGTPSPSDLDS